MQRLSKNAWLEVKEDFDDFRIVQAVRLLFSQDS